MRLPFTAVSSNSRQDDLSQSFGPWAVKLRTVQMFIVVDRGLARVGHAEDESNVSQYNHLSKITNCTVV